MSLVTVVRRLTFNAAHRVHNPELSDLENMRLFGKCNNPNWHGHNYVLEVSVRGQIEKRTGYVMDLARLKEVVSKEIVEKVISLIDDKDFEHRKAAIGALASIGKPAAAAKDRLQDILNDMNEDETIRGLAKKALKAVDPRKGLGI